MAFTAIIPGEVVGQEGEVYVAYESFKPRIEFVRVNQFLPIGRESRAGDGIVKTNYISLSVSEIIERDDNEVPTVARYAHA